MNPAILSAASALFGSLIGASAPVLTTWIVQRTQYIAQQRLGDRSRRETLYSDFIIEASARFVEAMQAESFEFGRVVTLHSLLNRIRLYGDVETVAAAEAVMHTLFNTYYEPPLSGDSFRETVNDAFADPLLGFSEQARIELLRLR